MYKIAFFFIILGIKLFAQMVNPAIDKSDEPFSYFLYPTDVIGVMDGREGTLVSPEGYLYTGSCELMFFTGNPAEPVNQRVKTLLDGYLPIIQYDFLEDGISYRFEMFAATLDGRPESDLINFIEVRIKNTLNEKRTAYFSTASRYQNEANTTWGVGDNRFGRPIIPERKGEFEQAGDTFNIHSEYTFTEDELLRDGKLLYMFSNDHFFQKMITLKTGYNEQQTLEDNKPLILANTPVGIVQYKAALNPGEEIQLYFKMPYLALNDQKTIEQMRKADYADYRKRTISFWNDLLAQGIDITVPEEKVNQTFKSNLIYDLIARDKIGEDYVQKVNEFQYDAFWLRDAATILRMYDLSGYHDIARQVLDFFPGWQREDGNFVSQGGQYDGWGQTMWAYGQHYLITRDEEYTAKIYPSLLRAFDWLVKTRREEPMHIIPVTTPGDNELITGHVTGHNFLALAGLKNLIAIAEGLGKKDDAAKFRKEYEDYFSTFMKLVKKVTSKTGGYIKPGLDDMGGQDWGNLLSVYPEIILDPHDQMVTATLDSSRKKYQEGIMTYGDGRYLHHYLTLNNTQTSLLRGEQEDVINELYAVLMHTSSTHAGFEFAVWPWSTRDFGMNLSPHGWFSAEYRILIRNMMLLEKGNELHLLSALSPEWVREGELITVKQAPCNFGLIDFQLVFGKDKAVMTINTNFRNKPDKLFIHLPWFMNVTEVFADGNRTAVKNSRISVPVNTKVIEIQWNKKSDSPGLSFQNTVDEFKKEYIRRYEEYLRNGSEFK